jgi:hypothetical protein
VPIKYCDILVVNEWHSGRCWSLAQVKGLCRSNDVDAGRIGCCICLLYPGPGS